MYDDAMRAAWQSAMAAIQANPARANVVFKAETSLQQNFCCTAKVRNFPVIMIDEPREIGGGNVAMNPVELVLVALGACQEIMFSACAAAMGIPLTEVKVDVKGYLDTRGLFGIDPDTRAGYQKITFETTIKSPADEATLRKLIETVENRCPLLDTLMRPIEVMADAYHINGQRHSPAFTKAASVDPIESHKQN